MDIRAGLVTDPLIAPSTRIYSARGIRRLLAAIFPECVDDRTLLCRTNMCRRSDHGKKNKGKEKQ